MKLLPFLQSLVPESLEATLRSAFQGLSTEQEVNIEAKLLAALEREKQAAVDREDYCQADHYKREIEMLLGNYCPAQSRAASFARAASFMTISSKGKGKGRGKGDAFDEDQGKGKGGSFTEGKGKGFGK